MAPVIAYLFSIFPALLLTTWHLQSFTCLLLYSDLHLPLFLPLSPPQPPSQGPVMGYCFSNLADRGTIFMYCISIFISHARIGPLVCNTHLLAPPASVTEKLLLHFLFLGGQMIARKRGATHESKGLLIKMN